MKHLLAVTLMALGITAIVLGGADDWPGLQGMGVLLFGGGVAILVRTRRGRAATSG